MDWRKTIRNAIQETLEKVLSETEIEAWSQKKWTEVIFKKMRDASKELGDGKWDQWDRFNKGEYLWDLVWVEVEKIDDKQNWRHMGRMLLACELEWSTHVCDQLYDLSKLFFCKAEVLLFVTEVKSHGDFEKLIGEAKSMANKCGCFDQSQRFYLAAYSKSDGENWTVFFDRLELGEISEGGDEPGSN